MSRLVIKISALSIIMAMGLIISSCGDGEGEKKPSKDTPVDTTETNDLNNDMTMNVEFSDEYALPSPIELYELIDEEGANFKGDILNDVNNAPNYNTTKSKAINFGIYASDLAYSSVFNRNQETFLYFKVAKDLADQLGLVEGFDESMLKRIDANINNSDSLFQIATDSYTNARNFLDGEDETSLLPLMIYGGWLESVYIAIRSVDNFSQDNGVLLRVAEQGILLENLIEFLMSFGSDPELEEILNELIDVQMAFDELLENDDETLITKEQFENISKLIFQLRNKYVG